MVIYWIVTALCHRTLNYFSYPAVSIYSLIIPSLLPTLFLGPSKSPSTSSFYELGILAFTFRGTQQLFGVKDINRNLTQRNTFLCGKVWMCPRVLMSLRYVHDNHDPSCRTTDIHPQHQPLPWRFRLIFPVESTLYLWEWVEGEGCKWGRQGNGYCWASMSTGHYFFYT